jgi:hypothetical protein
MDPTERQNFVRSYTKILTNAWSNEEFASQLRSSPAETLAANGLSVPSGSTVEILDSEGSEGTLDDQVSIWEQGASSGVFKLYVPEVPKIEEGELGESELEAVAGAGEVTVCCCCTPCCTST